MVPALEWRTLLRSGGRTYMIGKFERRSEAMQSSPSILLVLVAWLWKAYIICFSSLNALGRPWGWWCQLSRSRCVHRDFTVARPLTLSSKPALLTNKPDICHAIFVILVSINWLRPQDALRKYWEGSIFTGIRKQEIHLGWRPEKQICGYFKKSHED